MLMVDSYISLSIEFRRLTAPGTQENGWSNKLHLLLFYQELLFCLQGTRAEVASIALASPSVWGKKEAACLLALRRLRSLWRLILRRRLRLVLSAQMRSVVLYESLSPSMLGGCRGCQLCLQSGASREI
jgi:hypothetical protein